ncbi:lipocalin-like domain-containing protein [Azospirillum sp. B4]|uniref:lipocalin-like domain-containing protein n=1 Tax=Azospirillum sp. B4 TaxID=95605 RepID=UPI0005CAD1A3|nr:lipocalin-like domain-containing protein [Azospirillum sp. B4]
MGSAAEAGSPNQVLGTWRMVSAQLDPQGANVPAYGAKPNGLLSFTPDMHFVEVLTDADVPRFASDARGEGTDAENRIAMAKTIGFFGTYTVDEAGEFSGNRVEGSTFPNWIGTVRTRKELRLVVDGDNMTENFQRPDGTTIAIRWERVR